MFRLSVFRRPPPHSCLRRSVPSHIAQRCHLCLWHFPRRRRRGLHVQAERGKRPASQCQADIISCSIIVAMHNANLLTCRPWSWALAVHRQPLRIGLDGCHVFDDCLQHLSIQQLDCGSSLKPRFIVHTIHAMDGTYVCYTMRVNDRKVSAQLRPTRSILPIVYSFIPFIV